MLPAEIKLMESGENERQKPIDCTIPVFVLEYSLENLLMKEVMERENRNRSMKVLIGHTLSFCLGLHHGHAKMTAILKEKKHYKGYAQRLKCSA